MHGGVAKTDLKTENVAALEAGFSNLEKQVETCVAWFTSGSGYQPLSH